jgi:hemin uptake protein HemP
MNTELLTFRLSWHTIMPEDGGRGMADEDDGDRPEDEDEPAAPVIDVAEWFGDRREIWLELDGVRYRLRITRRNKLILQK